MLAAIFFPNHKWRKGEVGDLKKIKERGEREIAGKEKEKGKGGDKKTFLFLLFLFFFPLKISVKTTTFEGDEGTDDWRLRMYEDEGLGSHDAAVKKFGSEEEDGFITKQVLLFIQKNQK